MDFKEDSLFSGTLKIAIMKYNPILYFFSILCIASTHFSCGTQSSAATEALQTEPSSTFLLEDYVHTKDEHSNYEVVETIQKDGYQLHIVRMTSQKWLTEQEVKDPIWWHWLSIIVPDGADSDIGMLFIGGGSRKREQPNEADALSLQIALATNSVVGYLHNIPNQPMEFVGDDYGPRVEDELIAYGWRKFLEGGAQPKDNVWLARYPMTKAAVYAMDVISAVTSAQTSNKVEQFVVTGASKRGWTTWTTAATDKRVVAIAPIVIDLLNVVPSFQHHWRVYGQWAPAVGNYQQEGIMEWQGSKEYDQLLALTEPYSFREKLTMPKLLLNATGDQFFIPDSWQFYWDDLTGEKHLRYVPNSEHSMRETDVLETLIAFYYGILNNQKRPEWSWKVENGTILIQTNEAFAPKAVTLWQANNPDARNFQVDAIGRAYESSSIPLSEDGRYAISIDQPAKGFSAFFVELTFDVGAPVPLKLSTGVVVTPDEYPFEAFESKTPMGTRK